MKNWRYWRNLLVFLLCLLGVSVFVMLIRLGWTQVMTYSHPPRRMPPYTPAKYGIKYQEIKLLTEDGIELKGWYTSPQNGVVILIAHGMAAHRLPDLHALFARHGYGVVSWDARAQGESGGELCTMGYYEVRDVKAALDFALSQDTVEQVGAYGKSMGAVTMIRAAAQYPQIKAVVADSAFLTLDQMIDQVVPIPLSHPFIQFFIKWETGISTKALRPIDDIGKISPRPVFLIQGDADKVVPPGSAQRLYDAAGEPRSLWHEAGVDHVAMYKTFKAEYEHRVIIFFDTYLLGK